MTATRPIAPASGVLIPICVLHANQRVDLALPAGVPVAELLPGMVNALGRLTTDAATQGFRVIAATGAELDQALDLAQQHVSAGSVLTLEVAGAAATDTRYDDLVEAIGTSVDSVRTPWRRGDSVQLSAYSAAGLFAVAAVLLATCGAEPTLIAVLGVVTALLVTLAAAVLVRVPVPNGALALALTVPALLGAAGYALLPGPATHLRMIATGVGVVAGSAACLVLPARLRAAAAGPLVAGLALLLIGGLAGLAGFSDQRAAAIAVALMSVAVMLAPWLGLASLPARIDALAVRPRTRIDATDVTRQVANADVAVLAVRIAAGLLTTCLAPLVAVDVAGAALMTCVGVGSMLGTRSLYGRAEVLAGIVGGMATIVATGVSSSLTLPGAGAWLAGLAIGVGGFVIAWNVVSVRLRPWLNRLADAVHVAALVAVAPLTIWILGLA